MRFLNFQIKGEKMRKSFLHLVAIILVAMGFIACSSTASCNSSEVKVH